MSENSESITSFDESSPLLYPKFKSKYNVSTNFQRFVPIQERVKKIEGIDAVKHDSAKKSKSVKSQKTVQSTKILLADGDLVVQSDGTLVWYSKTFLEIAVS